MSKRIKLLFAALAVVGVAALVPVLSNANNAQNNDCCFEGSSCCYEGSACCK
jgi:hypothetical protein